MPAALKTRIAARAADTNFSAYVSEVLAREERRLALIDFRDYMDDLYGPPTDEEMAEAGRDITNVYEVEKPSFFAPNVFSVATEGEMNAWPVPDWRPAKSGEKF